MAFDETRWSIVRRAGSHATGAREALEALCRQYWPPLYSFLRARGHAEEDARDLLQGFFLAILEKDFISRARPEAGRFRTFLLTGLIHYASNDYAKQRAIKRGGHITFVYIDGAEAENHHQRIPSTTGTPEELYERQWAHGILEGAIERLGKTYKDSGKGRLFLELCPALASPETATDYQGVAERLGMTQGAVRVAAHRMKARYRESLSQTVAETLDSPADIEDEIRYLIHVLSR